MERQIVLKSDIKTTLGNGTLTLMDQRQLVDFAVTWIEQERLTIKSQAPI